MYLYPQNILHDLEFELILNEVLKLSVTNGGREKLKALKPMVEFNEINHQLKLVNEFLAVYQTDAHFPAMGIEPLSEAWVLLKVKNTTLTSELIVSIKVLVDVFNRLHHFVHQNELLPYSTSIFEAYGPNKEIPKEIDRIIDQHGMVKSSASKLLSSIRNEISKKKQAADRIFYRALKKYQKNNVLGEFAETVADNKRVLAVQSTYKGQVHGIIHGSSTKNSLVFVEPGECIDVNNEIASLEDDERKEVQRILKELTSYLSEFRDYLMAIEQIIFQVDFVHSKAFYAHKTNCSLPKLSTKPEIKIIEGLNPALLHFHKEKKKPVIPLNVELNAQKRILVISGPNAGGKSITLKTVGLFQAMIQAGLLIPANPKSVIGLFYKLMTDIGDAQSIENELSTYSSKLAKMEHFLNQADDRSLVLIDEFGSGSDPELGSALAQVFLKNLEKFKAFGIITTHYNSIKSLASELEFVGNASMRFNERTFSPEYVLQTGTPGSSYTFEVAVKSGIPQFMVNDAKELLDQKTVKIDRLLVQVQREKNKLNKARKKLFDKLENLEETKTSLESKIKETEAKLAKQTALNEEMNAVLKWGKRFESIASSWLKDSSNKNKKAMIGRFVKMMKERSGEIKVEEKQERQKQKLANNKKLQKQLKEEVSVGDTVKLLSNNKRGSLQEIRKNKYLILLGANITTLVSRDQFVKVSR
jgi:DNA mismatch repair protein MutS2